MKGGCIMIENGAQIKDPWQDQEYFDWIQTATDEEIREHVAEVLAGIELE